MLHRTSLALLLVVVVLGVGSAYRIPSEDIEADVEIDDLLNPTYFTYKIHVVLGNSEEFDVVGSTKDGNKRITVEPAVGGPKTKYIRQEVSKTTEGGKPVIKLVLKSTVRNIKKKIKYNGFTTITYKAHQDVQWFTDHEAVGVLGYKGQGCDPDDLECNDNETEVAPVETKTTTPRPTTTTTPEYDGPLWGNEFNYVYNVEDSPSQNLYSNNVESNGDVVKGEYRTLLPDGRTEIVSYTADWKYGYRSKVRYEGSVLPRKL